MKYIYPVTKDQQTNYRVYYPYVKKKIYLGLYEDFESAKATYDYIDTLMHSDKGLDSYQEGYVAFTKFVTLLNYRNTKIYFSFPIYLHTHTFSYYIDRQTELIFDKEDLFFCSTHKLKKRGGYLYAESKIAQTSLLSRFGIPTHSRCGKDYVFKNGNPFDFRRENLSLINTFIGVSKETKYQKELYVARITLKNTRIIGHYESELEAAIAYNKAATLLMQRNPKKQYPLNHMDYLTASEYREIYQRVQISDHLLTNASQKKAFPTKGFRGVSSDKGSFRASIGYKGKQIYLGSYPTKERAAQAYNFASFYLYGSKGYVNPTTPLIHSTDEAYIAQKLEKAHHLKR